VDDVDRPRAGAAGAGDVAAERRAADGIARPHATAASAEGYVAECHVLADSSGVHPGEVAGEAAGKAAKRRTAEGIAHHCKGAVRSNTTVAEHHWQDSSGLRHVERCAVSGSAHPHSRVSSADGDEAERHVVGYSGGCSVEVGGDELAHPTQEGGVPFRLESFSAQDSVDSGDETTWSGLRAPQVREDIFDVIDDWLEGVEYEVPRPPKKPGGWATDRRQLSLVLSLVLFLSLGLASKSQNICDSTKVPLRALVSECGGVTLWSFRADSQ
jgi:hypothetical protein